MLHYMYESMIRNLPDKKRLCVKRQFGMRWFVRPLRRCIFNLKYAQILMLFTASFAASTVLAIDCFRLAQSKPPARMFEKLEGLTKRAEPLSRDELDALYAEYAPLLLSPLHAESGEQVLLLGLGENGLYRTLPLITALQARSSRPSHDFFRLPVGAVRQHILNFLRQESQQQRLSEYSLAAMSQASASRLAKLKHLSEMIGQVPRYMDIYQKHAKLSPIVNLSAKIDQDVLMLMMLIRSPYLARAIKPLMIQLLDAQVIEPAAFYSYSGVEAGHRYDGFGIANRSLEFAFMHRLVALKWKETQEASESESGGPSQKVSKELWSQEFALLSTIQHLKLESRKLHFDSGQYGAAEVADRAQEDGPVQSMLKTFKRAVPEIDIEITRGSR